MCRLAGVLPVLSDQVGLHFIGDRIIMDYRNSGAASHLGKGFITGVDGLSGIEHDGSTIVAASDSAAAGLTVRAKGTGTLQLGDSSNVVQIGGSTTPYKLVTGISTTAVPNMPANSMARSTMTCVGISTGDIIISVSARDGLSTGVGLLRSYAGVDEIINEYINPHASSIAAEAALVCRWAYIDRT